MLAGAGLAVVALGAPLSAQAAPSTDRGAPSIAPTVCEESGAGCAVGVTGPVGGVVFYDAGSMQWWGRYLEAWPTTLPVNGPWGSAVGSIYSGDTAARRATQRQAMAIGMGRVNTDAMAAAGAALGVKIEYGGASERLLYSPWYLPSKDELDLLYNAWRSGRVKGQWKQVPVWTSTESKDTFAWYQLFQDGTQFTDANGIIFKARSNKASLTSQRHTGSAFIAQPMHMVLVRAFPPWTGTPPPPAMVAAVRTEGTCATTATGCAVGDLGPAGGIVVYDAGREEVWGRYLEVAPKACEQSGLPFAGRPSAIPAISAAERIAAKAIGTGAANTARLVREGKFLTAAFAAATGPCGRYKDWFLPSKDELNEACRVLSHSRKDRELTPAGGFDRGYYWTSSDYNGKTAWAQYFADCQQFDRMQNLTRNMSGARRPFLVRPMRAFGTGEVRD